MADIDRPKRYDSNGFELISPLAYLEQLLEDVDFGPKSEEFTPFVEEVAWWERLHPPDSSGMKEGPSPDG